MCTLMRKYRRHIFQLFRRNLFYGAMFICFIILKNSEQTVVYVDIFH